MEMDRKRSLGLFLAKHLSCREFIVGYHQSSSKLNSAHVMFNLYANHVCQLSSCTANQVNIRTIIAVFLDRVFRMFYSRTILFAYD